MFLRHLYLGCGEGRDRWRYLSYAYMLLCYLVVCKARYVIGILSLQSVNLGWYTRQCRGVRETKERKKEHRKIPVVDCPTASDCATDYTPVFTKIRAYKLRVHNWFHGSISQMRFLSFSRLFMTLCKTYPCRVATLIRVTNLT